MKKGNMIASVLVMALSIYVIVVCMGYPTAEAYGTGAPGPGLWPMTAATCMLVAGLVLFVKALRTKAEDDTPIEIWTDGTKRVYITMAILVVYVALLGVLGFIPCTIVMLYIFINWFAKKKPVSTAVISILTTMIIYCIFRFVLEVPVDFGLISF